jgi:hypothetical protein
MANFNLADYEPVDSRIHKFWADNPDGTILTEDVSTDFDRSAARWVFKASIIAGGIVRATGYAAEIDGQGNVNRTSVVENAETSAIGRALANFGYSGNKRASREEMEKVERLNNAPRTPVNASQSPWRIKADNCFTSGNLDGLRAVYADMTKAGAPKLELQYVAGLAAQLKEPQAGGGGDGPEAHASDTNAH